MFENIDRDADERGQVGIGTLIVFIALVLVAAIAAGVLINTAGFLQNQAESTGQESTNQVSEGVQVTSATGTVDSTNNNISTVTLTVSLSPGADGVNLSKANIEFLGSQAYTLEGQNDDDVDFQDTSGTTLADGDANLLDTDDRVQITLDLSADGTGSLDAEDLSEGSEAEVTITTNSGAQTVDVLNVPEPLGDKSAVSL